MLVICNGMQRSGSTLQYNLARELVERLGVGEGIGFFELSDYAKFHQDFENYIASERYYVIKMHDLLEQYLYHENVFFIYTFRHICDVITSAKNKWNFPKDSIVEMLDASITVSNKIKGAHNLLSLRYEDSVNNELSSAITIANFLKLRCDQKIAKEIAMDHSLTSVERKIEKANSNLLYKFKKILFKLKLTNPHIDTTLYHGDHITITKGQVGSWRDHLSEDEIKFYLDRYQKWLRQNNYID